MKGLTPPRMFGGPRVSLLSRHHPVPEYRSWTNSPSPEVAGNRNKILAVEEVYRLQSKC
jgi:hypothetical protein